MSQSPRVWLIHGWAANHHVFDPLYEAMPAAVQAVWQAPDLPGHGAEPLRGRFDLAAIADAYANRLNMPAHVLGWSLGGMVAMLMAVRHPHKVASLCLADSLPKLMAAADYPQGLKRQTLAAMVTHFEADYQQYMEQFLAVQMMYAPKAARTRVRQLLPVMAAGGAPSGLQAALAALVAADLRPVLGQIHCPTLLVYGARDALTPVRMGAYLHQHIAGSHLHIIDRAAHAPFLSHTAEFACLLTHFWEHFTA